MGRAPIAAQKRAQIEALIRSGMGRNAVAAEAGVSGDVVTRIAQAAGLSFDRSATAAATEAARADNAKRRADLIQTLYARAGEFLEQITQPHMAFAFGGKDNVYTEHEVSRPPTGDIKNLMVSTGIAIQRAADLERFDAPDSSDGVKSMLAGLGRALGVTQGD